MNHSQWRTTRIGDASINIIDGDRSAKYPKRDEFQDEGALFLNTTNIADDRLDLTSANFISEEKYSTISKGRIQPLDIIMTTRGSVGKVALYSRPDKGLINAQMLILRADGVGIDPRFLFHLVRSEDFQRRLKNFASGSAQPQIPITDLRAVTIRYPEIGVQREIASILSAYDDLIENNSRRIKILEQMAQMLYREWFVNFRFPGHEKVKMVDSDSVRIPEGWLSTTLGANVNLESGKRPKGGIREETDGVPSIGAENINGIGRHDFKNEKLVPRAFFEEMEKGVVQDRDVALYKDGAYIGKSSYFRDGFPQIECCVNEHVFLLRGHGDRLKQNFLYLWLQQPDTVQAIRATNANAAQPGINQQSVRGLGVVLPDGETAARFDRTVEPLLAEIVNLAKQNLNLQKTRDLLLPKLVSGEISVEQIESEVAAQTV